MTEEWRDVPGFEGVYQVSSLGNVKRCGGTRKTNGDRTARVRERVWPGHVNYQGYYGASLGRGRRVTVHRLVCEAFHGPAPEGKNQVGHYDGNKLNNAATNLRWVDAKDNRADGRRLGEIFQNERHWKARLTRETVNAIRQRFEELGGIRGSYSKIAREFGLGRSHAREVIKREVWSNV